MESDNRIHQETKGEKRRRMEREWNGKRSAQDIVCADPSNDLQPYLGLLFCCSVGLDKQGHALNGLYGSKKAGSCRVDHLNIRIIFFFRRGSHEMMMNHTGSYARRSLERSSEKRGLRVPHTDEWDSPR
jgi:hypothetical protein